MKLEIFLITTFAKNFYRSTEPPSAERASSVLPQLLPFLSSYNRWDNHWP